MLFLINQLIIIIYILGRGKQKLKKYLLLLIFVILVSGQVAAEEITAEYLLGEVIQTIEEVEDFKGMIISRVYSGEKVFDYRNQIMKSPTRTMTQSSGNESIHNRDSNKLLNIIPWIYLPPEHDIVKKSLPLEGGSMYQQSLSNLEEFYSIELLGEAIYDDQEVYIIQLENAFTIQRLFLDKEKSSISKIDIYNGANIKLATILYEDYKLFNSKVWFPTKIAVENSRQEVLMEVLYKNWQVNTGLTDFDFAKGFDTSYQEEIDNLKAKLELQSENDKLYWLISDLYKKDGDLSLAVSNLQQAIRIKDKVNYRKRLAELYQLQGKYKEALVQVQAALQIDYNNADLHYLLAEIQLHLNKINTARFALEKTIELDGDNPKYLEKLFWVYNNLAENSNDYMLERAKRIATKLVELKPDNKDYRIYLGDIFFELGDKLKAASSYNKAIELAPEDTWGYIKLAQFYEEVDKSDKSEELYRYVLYLDDSLENQRRLANFYFEQGKYKLALAEYEELNDRTTANLEVKMRLAESYLATEDLEKGLDAFDQILQDNQEGQFYLEVAKIVKKYSLDEAINIYQTALNQEELLNAEEKDLIYKELGYIYFKVEEEEYFEELDQLLQINSQAEIYNLLGEYKFIAGDLDKAIHYFKLALDKYNSHKSHYNLSLSYLIADHFDLAQNEAERLISLGYEEEGQELIDLINNVKSLRVTYTEKYVPGRINRIKGDKLREEGKLNEALIKYKESIFENYNYNLSYFYLGVISTIKDDTLQLRLAENGLNKEETEVLTDFVDAIEKINKL